MEKQFTKQESLSLINEMISTAKGEFSKGMGKQFLLWGYLITLASIANFIMTKYKVSGGVYGYTWLGVMIIGVAASLIIGYYYSKEERVKSYTTRIVGAVWIGFIISIIAIMILLSGKNGWYIYPAITFLYTFSIYITAVALKFRWMYISIALCAVATIAYRFVPFEYYPLIMAFAMICGNIAPGHMISNINKRQSRV